MSGQKITPTLRSIDIRIKCLNKELRDLREQKRKLTADLVHYMKDHNLEKLEEFELSKLVPKKRIVKEKVAKKTPTQKKKDGIQLIKQIGIVNPEQFYNELLKTQN